MEHDVHEHYLHEHEEHHREEQDNSAPSGGEQASYKHLCNHDKYQERKEKKLYTYIFFLFFFWP